MYSPPAGTRAAIIGAGPVGCVAALILARHGFVVDLYEKRQTLSQPTQRSINLSLNPRGQRALQRVGAWETIREASVYMEARAFHTRAGDITLQRYGDPGWRTYSIGRGELNQRLLSLVQRNPSVRVHYGCTCLDVALGGRLVFQRPDLSVEICHADLIVGTDGAASEVRTTLMRVPSFELAKTAWRGGYRELTLRPKGGDFAFYPNAIHIWPRGDFFMVALPNQDRTLRATLILPEAKSQTLQAPEDLRALFREQLPDIVPHLSESPEEILQKPFGEIATVRCGSLHFKDKILLLGDAAHAVVPFMGQGVNLGLEDCQVLDELMEKPGQKLEEIFTLFQQRRLAEVLACADLSAWNFHELVSGRPPTQVAGAPSPVAQVNFSGKSYQSLAEQFLPGWRPKVV